MKKALRYHAPTIEFYDDSVNTVDAPEWVQLMRVGIFYDLRYGTIKVSEDTFLNFMKNFESNVRGVDLAIDYSHESWAEAAGWIRELELRESNTELWARVEWTPEGRRKVKGKEFRYLSADFTLNYEDNETLRTFGPVLYGAGLTNRPLIKDMAPTIALHELTEKERNDMEELIKAISEMQKAQTAQFSELTKQLSDFVAAQKPANEPAQEIQAGEDKEDDMAKMKKKLEDLMGENKSLKEQLAKLSADKKASERSAEFDKLMSEGRAVEAQRQAFCEGNMDEFVKLSANVNLKPAGHGNAPAEIEVEFADDAVKALTDKADEMVKSEGIEFAQAMSKVIDLNPELARKAGH